MSGRFDYKEPHSKNSFTEIYTETGEFTIDFYAKFGKDSSFLVENYITVSIQDPMIEFDYHLEKSNVKALRFI